MRRFLLLLLLIISTVASAKTYYVATNGSDVNNGTSLSTPFATWKRGFTAVNAGDTLFIRGGVYYLSGLGAGVEGRASGTKENPICILAYPPDWDLGNKPILDCSGVIPRYATDFAAISFNGVQYIHLKGLTVRNLYQRYKGEYMPEGFSAVACANFTFKNCTAQNISGRGFWYHSGAWNEWDGPGAIFDYDTTRWINCDAFDLRDSLSVNPGNAADGWKCHAYQGNYYILEGCRAWNYSDDGFDISGSGHRTFINCWAMSTEKYASMDIEGNGFKCTGAQSGYYFPQYLTDTTLVRYIGCLAAFCHASGFANNVNNNGDDYIQNNALIINNTAYHNATGFWDEGVVSTRSPLVPRYINNIAISSTHYEYGEFLYEVSIWNPPIYFASHNNWMPDPQSTWPGWIYNPAFTVTNDDFVSTDSSQIHAARKKDGSLPDITFLKLAPGSDLIDAGVNVGLPYYGSAPDVGYSEYNSGSVTVPVPEYVKSVIENATPARLEMTYNLTLANIVPATSAFTVKVNSVTRSVSSVAISGTKVLLTLASPVVYGDAVTVAYTKPITNPLQTVAGGQAASITAKNVTNNVAAVIPAYVSSVIENATPARLEMTYNLTLANIVPATSAFTVKVNSVTRSVSSVAISGTKVLLTLASPVVYGDAVTVAYTKPITNPLQTVAGGQAASITASNVTNNVAAVIPAYVGSVIENATPARLEMTYNLTLANIVPATSAFTVKVNSVTRSVSSVAISGTKVLLTLASPVVYGDAVTVAYTKPITNPLQTVAGGQAASITASNVTNNVAAVIPAYVGSVIENATPARLEMTYNLTLANIVPATSAFTVKVNSVTRSVSSVAISGTKVLLTLASPVVYGDAVTVAYTKPSTNPLQTIAGGQAISLSAINVINNCSPTANQPPVITITSPTKSTAFISPATITIEATASDPDGSIIKVEFFNGTTKLGESFAPPFVFTLKEVLEGSYTYSAVATDNLNAKAVSAAVDVIVEKSADAINQLPIVDIFIPTGNSKKPKKHDNVVLKAEAYDPDGTISKVEIKSGNITLAEFSTGPYEFTLNDIDTGTYIIYAVATDNLNASNTSSSIEFHVTDWNNTSPDIIDLYPNPNNGRFTLEFLQPLPSGDKNMISIVSLRGESVFNDLISDQEYYKEINLPDAAAGAYVLFITRSNKIIASEKFIINK